MKKPTALPTTEEEARWWAEGYRLVAGLDEVGRGPIAGPVVAGAVTLTPDTDLSWAAGVNDSKQLTAASRDRLADAIYRHVPCGVGLATVAEIARIGIAPACRLAMVRALAVLPVQPDALLLDAFPLPESPLPQQALIKGDSRSIAIAAASIIAKVERDALMVAMAKQYPGYGLERHKGYATAEHLSAIERLGACPAHRLNFAPFVQPSMVLA